MLHINNAYTLLRVDSIFLKFGCGFLAFVGLLAQNFLVLCNSLYIYYNTMESLYLKSPALGKEII
jgi:hypothetical protein